LYLLNSSHQFIAQVGNSTTNSAFTAPIVFTYNKLSHIALVWDGTTVNIYLNGTKQGSGLALGAGNTGNPAINLSIGNQTAGGRCWPGWIQEVRISKNARYTANFSVPETPFVNDANTVGLWHLNEGTGTNCADSGSNSLTGTASGTPVPAWVSGHFAGLGATTRTTAGSRQVVKFDLGKCCTFNGSTSNIGFPRPDSMLKGNIPTFSLAAWVFATGTGGGTGGRIFDGVNAGILVGYSSGNIRFQVTHSTAAYQDSPTGVFKQGVWNRVLMTWSDAWNIPKIYINGVNYTGGASQNKSGSRGDIAATSYIGNRGTDRGWSGQIDELCVWNRVLSDSEITQDYINPTSVTTGLILHYQMDEASGNLADTVAGIVGTPSNVTQNVTGYSSTRTAV